ncbi:cation diffusion facilitator family transporter [Tessaracoccus sp. OS52]|uniref:cation diffusion facilitator family transporter n=1 Tax=Tessaracoccus sp. OS52 TaxID=2886691 RepID=UPI001D123615|nr:cation diffusion facilitator family transporter [Tessaracoccus sp. OS52]MCC2593531.1 cation diffusion facilitator family transporter [Tessaracoccus sp. OS52]
MSHEHDHHEHDHHEHDHHEHDHDHDHGTGTGSWSRLRHALIPHSHDHTEAIQTAEQASAVGIRAAWISLAGMGATALLQIVIVALSGSIALLADTVHNLGHLATTIPLIIAFRLGRRAPTRRFPYGFKRAEDLVGLFIGLVVAISAAIIIWESVRAISNPRDLTNLGWVLAAAIIGAAGNELVARYRIRAGRRIGSAALVAEGQHARTDALTSLAVIIGVVGAWVGLPQLDPIVGLVIAAVILAVLYNSMRTVIHRLMDGVEPGTLDLIEAQAARVDGVLSVRRARARWLGHRMEADVEVEVEPGFDVDGDAVAHRVREHLLREVPHLDNATVHACGLR